MRVRSALSSLCAGATVAAALVLPAAGASAAAVTTYRGTTGDGSKVLLEVPAGWNGTLLLYSHGYRQAGNPRTGVNAAPKTAQDASDPATGEQLLARGYALAGSSYARNGWAVLEGVRADRLLDSWVRSKIGNPARVYAWGDSLGGLITATYSAIYPSRVTAQAPLCGVLGGARDNLDLALDFEIGVKALLYPQLKLDHFSSYAEALANFDRAFNTIKSGVTSKDQVVAAHFVSRLIAVQMLVDGPAKTQSYDGQGLTSAVGAALESVATGLYYATVDRYEFEQRVHGNPSTNVGVDYRRRIGSGDIARYESFGFSAGLLRSLAGTVNSYAVRVHADPAARLRAASRLAGNPTGALAVPTLTMHTAFDPLVLVQNESLFAKRVAAHHSSGRLEQLFIAPPASYSSATGAPYGAGHCNFTPAQQVAALGLLDQWSRSGVKPGAAQVAAAFAGIPGLAAGYRPPAWPVR